MPGLPHPGAIVKVTREFLSSSMREQTWELSAFQERSIMRKKISRWCMLFAAMLALCLIAVPARAADDDDPPARAARLSYTSGAVSFEPAGTEDWVDAVVNRPMTTGDKLWADQDARAEVRIDSLALRLGAQTGFSFLNLDDKVVQVRLSEGSLN